MVIVVIIIDEPCFSGSVRVDDEMGRQERRDCESNERDDTFGMAIGEKESNVEWPQHRIQTIDAKHESEKNAECVHEMIEVSGEVARRPEEIFQVESRLGEHEECQQKVDQRLK